MSGHSKWSTIKRAKGKTDAARGKLFTKLGKVITVAVKQGGPDLESNPALATAISKAKSNNMPNDNITRCIKKASGETDSANYIELTYEGYGNGGSAVIVEVLTDNKNRTAGDVRHLFDKFGGSLGTTNSVAFLFDKKGLLIIEKSDDFTEDQLFEWILEAEAEDMQVSEEGYEVYTTPANFNKVREYLETKSINFLSAEVEMIPQTYVELNEAKFAKFEKMIELMEDHEDVQNVYHNVKEV